jgi:glycosyltransferase involved in cell wall biosynthesis
MKIAYVINQYPQASHSFIRREIAALESLGVEVHRFTVRRWPQQLVDSGDQLERSKTRAVLEGPKPLLLARLLIATFLSALTRPAAFFRALRQAIQLGRRAGRLPVHLIYLAEACVLRRWIAATGATHVHAHFGTNSAAVAMLIRALGGPPYSFTVHGPEEFERPHELALDLKSRHAACVFAVSAFGRAELQRLCRPEDHPKLHVIRCGLDAAYLSAEPTEVPDVPRLVCMGRLAEQKGQLVLIDAAAKLKSAGTNFDLLLIGDGPLRGPIESRITQLHLSDRVRLAGWMTHDQIRHELLNARAMVLPSFAEGLPVVLMESLALGRPVITTPVAGVPELVTENESGWLVSPGDVAALADAMHRALTTSTADLTRMGRAGAAKVREQHDACREAEKLLRSLAPCTHGERAGVRGEERKR